MNADMSSRVFYGAILVVLAVVCVIGFVLFHRYDPAAQPPIVARHLSAADLSKMGERMRLERAQSQYSRIREGETVGR